MSVGSSYDFIVVGTGPSGVAFVERLAPMLPTADFVLLERGDLLLDRHFLHRSSSHVERSNFLEEHSICPWLGDLSEGGRLLPAVGGRGVLGGTQLQPFYSHDLQCWDDGRWPVSPDQMAQYSSLAATALVGEHYTSTHAQDAAIRLLAGFRAQHPPVRGKAATSSGWIAHQCASERLLRLLRGAHGARVKLLKRTRVLNLITNGRGDRIVGVRCKRDLSSGSELVQIGGSTVVLAASSIESTRLVLDVADRVGYKGPSFLGGYLAEHIYVRGLASVGPLKGLGEVNIVVPPDSGADADRFHVEVRSLPPGRHSSDPTLRVTACIAMDPCASNRITLSSMRDSAGVRRADTFLHFSAADLRRVERAMLRLDEVCRSLGAQWIERPRLLPKGASYHEAGGLRIGEAGSNRVSDASARVLRFENVYVADGAAFPSVGVANPILTLTAMAYRLADHLAAEPR